MKLLDRNRWPFLLTYADTWQGHTGHIYKASNWKYLGQTQPLEVFVKNGVMVSKKKKVAKRTFTRTEMTAMGADFLGCFPKHKFVHAIAKRQKANADAL